MPIIRLSSYSILSDPLPGGGYALMNGLTGAIDLVSDEIARAISDFDRAPTFPPEAVSLFLNRGHFTFLTQEEEIERVSTLAALLHEEQKSRPVFMIVPSFDCNYRCVYCFERPLQKGLVKLQSEVSYHNQNVVMTSSNVEAVYRSIREIKKLAGDDRETGQILLYGGEPLNADNEEIVFEIVRRGAREGFEFAAVSNGHDWDHFLPLFGEGGLRQAQVSIDGPRAVHDRRRIHREGESSFEKIIANLHAVLLRGGVTVQIRFHADPSTIDLFDELLGIIDHEGWLDNRSVVVYANTVYAKDKAGRVSARIENGDLMARMKSSASRYKNVFVCAPALNARMQILPSLTDCAPYRLKSTYCAANYGNYIFAPDGFIYACWEAVGECGNRIGSYLGEDGPLFDERVIDRWFNRHAGLIGECLKCPHALVCGGGCAQYAEYNDGTLYKPFCDDFDRIFRSALADNVEEFLRAQESGRHESVERAELCYK